MNETLKDIINNYRAALLSTPNIQVIEKKLSDETIEFPKRVMFNLTFAFSTFKNSALINMKFINVALESSYFEKCLVENTIFENTLFGDAEFDSCVFKNCQFINCKLSDVDGIKTIFNECTFIKSSFNNNVFKSCYFLKPSFKNVTQAHIGSGVLIDSKFSNSNKLIEFEREVYFNDVFDRLKDFDRSYFQNFEE